MASLKHILLSLCLLVAAEAQLCTPGIVPNVSVSSNNLIQWAPVHNPSSCVISGYIIDIMDTEDNLQFQFQTGIVLYYRVTALEVCKSYIIDVRALTSQNVLGPSDRINATMPAGTTLNLTVTTGNVTFNNSELSLTWTPNSVYYRCISYYRVVYWDETNVPTDVYVPSNNFTLTETPVPCMEYKFQITAIVSNPDTEGPAAEMSYVGDPALTSPPRLIQYTTSETMVNMTWRIPTYSENRCNLTALVVRTIGLPASITRIVDSALRSDIAVALTNLTSNTVYTSYVSLENSVGFSPNVTFSFQTLDDINYDNDYY